MIYKRKLREIEEEKQATKVSSLALTTEVVVYGQLIYSKFFSAENFIFYIRYFAILQHNCITAP